MLREFLQKKKGGDLFSPVEQPELSLGPSSPSLILSDVAARKRKPYWEEQPQPPLPTTQSSIELQLQAPLPPDWEQCLDLQSGRMYYVNRRTMRKSWEWPREQKLDLELNISTPRSRAGSPSGTQSKPVGSRMVAVPCLRCHLLVMLSTSSPSCPNCKFVHSLSDLQKPSPNPRTKPLETLSLLH